MALGQKNYYTFEAFKTLYELPSTDFLKYYTLIQSIPIACKQKLSEMEFVNFYNNTLLQNVQTTKKCVNTCIIYNKL